MITLAAGVHRRLAARRRTRGERGERGSGLIEITWAGLILIIPLAWIVFSVFQVQRAAFSVSGAARAAGRAYVLADTDGQGRARAEAAADQAVRDQGADVRGLRVEVRCAPYAHQCHSGTSVVTVTVTGRIALPGLPSILGGGAPSLHLDASHTVPVGQYQEIRDGR